MRIIGWSEEKTRHIMKYGGGKEEVRFYGGSAKSLHRKLAENRETDSGSLYDRVASVAGMICEVVVGRGKSKEEDKDVAMSGYRSVVVNAMSAIEEDLDDESWGCVIKHHPGCVLAIPLRLENKAAEIVGRKKMDGRRCQGRQRHRVVRK